MSLAAVAVIMAAGGCTKEITVISTPPSAECGTPDAVGDSGVDTTDMLPPDDAPSQDGDPDLPPSRPSRWTILIAAEAPEALHWLAEDLVVYLERMQLEPAIETAAGDPACVPGEGTVVLVGDGLGTAVFDTPEASDQTYRIEESLCPPSGVRVSLSGGGLLGRQYAGYEWLHALGVRFFHPEQVYTPSRPNWSAAPLQIEHTPAFRFRSTSLHLTHPLALGDAFIYQRPEYQGEVRRYIDWSIQNGASHGQPGLAQGELFEYGIRRGFMRTAGISLHNQQQGGVGVIDPDDPRSDEEQITAAIEARMGADPQRSPQMFSFSFNPSEFTEIDDRDVVRQITFIANYMAEHYPDAMLMTTNHGTGGEPTEHYGVRYYDLPHFAPANLGVTVHPLMFYDLFRPAPVYGNEDFHFLYDFMADEYRTRRLWYFPEAAWWLTFDIPVPLYLPITIEARDRDIQGIAFMLAGHLDGHRTFGTGHEWGYWQNEYCSFRMAADLDYRYTDCLADVVSPMGPAGGEVQAVLEEVIALQERDLIYGHILRYIVGTDPETELAQSLGVEMHPLPPAPAEIMRWDLEQVESWLSTIAPELERMDADYSALVQRLLAVAPLVPDDATSWFAEILDGIEVTGLRARHAFEVYGAVVTLRLSQLRFDSQFEEQAQDLLQAAFETTEDAIEVIRRREAHYRYAPLDRYIAGGPDGDQDDNWTIYHYRELNRTHHAYYYTRIDTLAEQAFSPTGEAVFLSSTVLGPGQSLVLQVVDPDLVELVVDFGDGHTSDQAMVEHDYASPGFYTVTVQGTGSSPPFSYATRLAQLEEKYWTGYSVQVLEPEGAEIIEAVLPGLTFGPVSAQDLVVGFDVDGNGDGSIRPDLWSALVSAGSANLFENRPVRMVVPVVSRATSTVMSSITVADAVITLEGPGQPARMTGDLETEAVIQAVVDIGGFDEQGARRIVASSLGYTPDTLPVELSLVLEYSLQ